MLIVNNHSAPYSESQYFYGTPLWAVRILLTLAIAFAMLCFVMFYRWPDGDAAFAKWFVLLIGVVSLSAGFRPVNWQAWTNFYADDEGIHFPSKLPKTKDTVWLLVPWVKVGSIKRDLFSGGKKGISIELLLKDSEIEHFFRNIQLTKMFFGQKVRENGFFAVGYSSVFNRIDFAVKVLGELKQKNTYPVVQEGLPKSAASP